VHKRCFSNIILKILPTFPNKRTTQTINAINNIPNIIPKIIRIFFFRVKTFMRGDDFILPSDAPLKNFSVYNFALIKFI
jgi:hypothetical protein